MGNENRYGLNIRGNSYNIKIGNAGYKVDTCGGETFPYMYSPRLCEKNHF